MNLSVDSIRIFFKNTFKYSKYLFTPVAISFIVYYAWQSRDLIESRLYAIDHSYLISSIFFWICLHFISPLFTVLSLKSIQIDLPYKNAWLIHTIRLPAKYIPGGIWHSLVRAYDYHSHNIDKKNIITYLVFENVMTALITLGLGGGILLLFTDLTENLYGLYTISCLVCLVITLIIPVIVKRNFITPVDYMDIKFYLLSLFSLVLFWLLAGLSFLYFYKAFLNIDVTIPFFQTIGTYIYSWGIGFISFFSPQGIGVFEYVLGNLLQTGLQIESMVVLLACFRILVFISDITTWVFSLILDGYLKRIE